MSGETKEELTGKKDDCPLCNRPIVDSQTVVQLRGHDCHKQCVKDNYEHMKAKYGSHGPPRNRADRRLYKRNPIKYRKQEGAHIMASSKNKRKKR